MDKNVPSQTQVTGGQPAAETPKENAPQKELSAEDVAGELGTMLDELKETENALR